MRYTHNDGLTTVAQVGQMGSLGVVPTGGYCSYSRLERKQVTLALPGKRL